MGTNIGQGMRDRKLGWAWRPDREQVKLTPAEQRILEQRRLKRLKRKAKKERRKARETAAKPSAARIAAAEFYDSWEWKKLRFEVLKAYGAVCMLCRSTERIVVDHIKPRRKFPELQLSFDNCQVLCDPCNRGKSWDDYTDFRPRKPEPELSGDELAHMKSI